MENSSSIYKDLDELKDLVVKVNARAAEILTDINHLVENREFGKGVNPNMTDARNKHSIALVLACLEIITIK